MKKIFYALALLFVAQTAMAQDPTLPDVENLRIEGDMLVWDPLEGATGYNIRLRGYYDTVRDSNSYALTEPGTYRVTAFNDSGEYGSDYGMQVEYGGNDPDNTVGYSYNYATLIVYQTCRNVEPGGSCTARCPYEYEPENQYSQTVYFSYMSGGACSTSDIVEADAWAGHRSYQCTVPTFSGEVVAQAICVRR